jgi:hypothetical protein
MKITKIILYWIMVLAIVTGGVYYYKQIQFGRKIAILYQLATGNTTMGPGGSPGGAPPGGMGPGGERMMPPGGQQQEGMQGQQTQMGQNIQGVQGQSLVQSNTQAGQPAINSEGAQDQQTQPGQAGGQPPQMGQNMQGDRGDFQKGGRQGGPPGGKGPSGPQGSWYTMNLRTIWPYTFILAFCILITCVIDKAIKGSGRSKKMRD